MRNAKTLLVFLRNLQRINSEKWVYNSKNDKRGIILHAS